MKHFYSSGTQGKYAEDEFPTTNLSYTSDGKKLVSQKIEIKEQSEKELKIGIFKIFRKTKERNHKSKN